MELVGSVAAISQLALYVQCAVRGLRHICETLKTSTSVAKSQLEELQVLLEILDRIQRHHSPSDIEDLVPVLISIADTTQILRNWFEPPKTLRQKLNLIAHQSEVEESFRRLREKYNLLVLYYSERSDRALGRIESSLNARHHVAAESTETMSSPITQNSFTSMSRSSGILPQRQEIAPPCANTTSTDASPMAGQPTEEMFKAFFYPRSNLPHTGRTEQPPKHEEEGQSSKKSQANMSVEVSNNRHFYTNAEIFQNRPEDSVTQASYTGNDVAGGSMKVGGMTHQDGKEKVKDEKYEKTP